MTETKPETFPFWVLHAARLMVEMNEAQQMQAFGAMYLISKGHRAEFPSAEGARGALPIGLLDVSLSHGRPRIALNLDNPDAKHLAGKAGIPVYLRPARA